MTPEQMAEKRTERLSRELTLTDAQAKQVYQLNLKDAQNAVQHRKEAEARREQMAAKWKTYQADPGCPDETDSHAGAICQME